MGSQRSNSRVIAPCRGLPVDKPPPPTYHSPIMGSEVFQLRKDHMLDKIEEAADQRG